MSRVLPKDFSETWQGGYFEGDARDYMGKSSFKIYGYISVTRAIYLTCIRPFIRADTTALEIGPGRGAWTKLIAELGPKSVQAVDVVSPEHSQFWQHVGKRSNVSYIQTDGFDLAEIEDDSISYFFSFGVFCHIPPEMCEQYIVSLAKKMKPGANGFLMVADFDKFNACIRNKEQTSILAALPEKRNLLARLALKLMMAWKPQKFDFPLLEKRPEGVSPIGRTNRRAGIWYHWGVDGACAALEASGFEIIERDMDQVPRDPIIHFRQRA